MLEAAIKAGANDVVSGEEGHEIYCEQRRLEEVSHASRRSSANRGVELIWRAQNPVAVDDEAGEKLLRLMEILEDHDDVQNVFANFEVSTPHAEVAS